MRFQNRIILLLALPILMLAFQNCGKNAVNAETVLSQGQLFAARSPASEVDGVQQLITSGSRISLSATGRMLYVDTTIGSDSNSGLSLSLPWKTISKAANSATAGDTVFIRAGTYREQLIPKNSGTSSEPIIFTAYNNETVILDGTGRPEAWSGMVDINGRAHIHIVGLNIRNYQSFGVCIQNSNNIKILKNKTLNTGRSGVYARNSQTILIDGNEVAGANTILNQESISITAGTNDFIVSNNIVRDGKMEGIDVKAGSFNGKVSNNTVYGMARIGIYLDGFASGVHSVIVENNLVRDPGAGTNAGLDAIRVGAEAGGFVNDVVIRNNIVYSSKANGIVLSKFHHVGKSLPRYSNISIVNNTVYSNGNIMGGGIGIEESTATGIVIANNILSLNKLYQIRVDPSVTSAVTVKNNLVHKPVGQGSVIGEALGTNVVLADPQFVDVDRKNFQLQATSPAIDSGVASDLVSVDFAAALRPQGGGHDIGAFELAASVEPPPAPSPGPAPAPGSIDTVKPDVVMSLPADGAAVPVYSWVRNTALATDLVGVKKVEIYVNSVLLCTQYTAPYICGFVLPGGIGSRYTVYAIAYDAAGNSRTSKSITYTSTSR